MKGFGKQGVMDVQYEIKDDMKKADFELVRVTDLSVDCGHYKPYADDEFGDLVDECLHPESETHYCTAAACPLGALAEKSDFKKAGRSNDYEEGEYVVISKNIDD